MNAQERDRLQSFLREVSQTRPAQKDPLAESMIRSALGSNPDALYVLVQRALGANSFLGTAASVATGVVAGGFLFEGVQSVLRDTGVEEGVADGLNSLGDITDWV